MRRREGEELSCAHGSGGKGRLHRAGRRAHAEGKREEPRRKTGLGGGKEGVSLWLCCLEKMSSKQFRAQKKGQVRVTNW